MARTLKDLINDRGELVWGFTVRYKNPAGEMREKKLVCTNRYLKEFLGLLKTTGGCTVYGIIASAPGKKDPDPDPPEVSKEKHELRDYILKVAGTFD